MKMFRLNVLFAVLMALVVMSGCKKDDDVDVKEPGTEYVAPANVAQDKIVEVPAAIQNSQDPNVQMANMYIGMVNGFGSMTAQLAAIPSNATVSDLKSSGKVWTWSNMGITAWIELLDDEFGYRWRMYYQGGEYVTKTLVIEVTQDKLGLSGTMNIYSPEVVGAVVVYTWEKVGTSVNATLLFNGGDDAIFFTITADESGAGSLKIYYGASTAAVKIYDITWNAAGHGNWTAKDPETSETESGTF